MEKNKYQYLIIFLVCILLIIFNVFLFKNKSKKEIKSNCCKNKEVVSNINEINRSLPIFVENNLKLDKILCLDNQLLFEIVVTDKSKEELDSAILNSYFTKSLLIVSKLYPDVFKTIQKYNLNISMIFFDKNGVSILE